MTKQLTIDDCQSSSFLRRLGESSGSGDMLSITRALIYANACVERLTKPLASDCAAADELSLALNEAISQIVPSDTFTRLSISPAESENMEHSPLPNHPFPITNHSSNQSPISNHQSLPQQMASPTTLPSLIFPLLLIRVNPCTLLLGYTSGKSCTGE